MKNSKPTVSECHELMLEWDFEKNESLDVQRLTLGSNKKAWWKCHTCGYEWQSTIGSRAIGHNCPECAKAKRNLSVIKGKTHEGQNDVLSQAPLLVKEWDYDHNEILPNEISCHSNHKVWWKCERCGYRWMASVTNRYKGSRCPNCMRHYHTSYSEQAVFFYVKKWFPDSISGYAPSWLKKQRMEIDIFIPSLCIGIEYDGEAFHNKKEGLDVLKTSLAANHGIRIIRIREPRLDSIDDGSHIIVTPQPTSSLEYLERPIKELADFLNHQENVSINASISISDDYDEIIQSVHRRIGDKSFGTLYPEMAKEWDYEENGLLKPYEFLPSSNVKVYWKCRKCGYKWKASIGSRKAGHNCPACAGKKPLVGTNDLKTLYPEVSMEWSSKNICEPNAFLPNSATKVWWKCSECGHEWQATINNRVTSKSGCPKCARRKQSVSYRANILKKRQSFAEKHPELLCEWDYEKNATICLPNEITSGVHEKVWWKCARCGHEWQAVVYTRTNGRGCPACAKKKRK